MYVYYMYNGAVVCGGDSMTLNCDNNNDDDLHPVPQSLAEQPE
jgi:hypothetical protein